VLAHPGPRTWRSAAVNEARGLDRAAKNPTAWTPFSGRNGSPAKPRDGGNGSISEKPLAPRLHRLGRCSPHLAALGGGGDSVGPPPRLMHHAPLTPDLLLPARWSHPTPGGRTMTKKPTKGYVVDGRPMTADDLKRLHDYLADIEWIDVTSDEMRIVVESEWPEFIPQAAIETMIPRGTYFRRPIGESRRTKPNTSSVPRLRRLDRLPRPRPSVRARKAIAAPGAGSAAMTGAQFEIRIDSYRDRKDYAPGHRGQRGNRVRHMWTRESERPHELAWSKNLACVEGRCSGTGRSHV
jgi:hypothetical protein